MCPLSAVLVLALSSASLYSSPLSPFVLRLLALSQLALPSHIFILPTLSFPFPRPYTEYMFTEIQFFKNVCSYLFQDIIRFLI